MGRFAKMTALALSALLAASGCGCAPEPSRRTARRSPGPQPQPQPRSQPHQSMYGQGPRPLTGNFAEEGDRSAPGGRHGPSSPGAILARLEARRVTVDFTNEPLPEVAATISRLGGVNVVLAPHLGGERRVTFQGRDMTLRQVLSWALRLTGLRSRILREAIYITDAPSSRRTLRIYPSAGRTHPGGDYYPSEQDDEGARGFE